MSYTVEKMMRVLVDGRYRVLRPGQVIDEDTAREAGLTRYEPLPVAQAPEAPRHAKQPGPRDLTGLTVAGLREVAAARGLKHTRLRKHELLELLASQPEPHKPRSH